MHISNREKENTIKTINEYLHMPNNDMWALRVKRGLCRMKNKLGGYSTIYSFKKEFNLYSEAV